MSLPRYPEYKSSGLTWLGDIPSHWYEKRVKFVLAEAADSIKIGPFGSQLTSDMLTAEGYKVYGQENVIAQDFGRGARFISAEKHSELSAYSVVPGDILITMMGTSGRCSIVPPYAETGVMDSHLLRLRLSADIHPAYFQRLIDEAAYVAHQVSTLGKGSIMHGLNSGVVKQLSLAVPPHAEQVAIATFLDRETAKIDALIAEQEKLIALLAEKRQATISHAVTKGLNPNAPMKNSGVAWLGEVPAHWGVSALSYLASLETGSTPDRSEASYWNGSIPWLKTGEINWAPIRESEEFITEAGLANSAAKIAKPETLLMAMYGQGVTRGRVALLEIEATYNQACAAIRFGSRLNPEFGRYFFMAAYDHVRDAGNETSQMNLSAGLIAKIRLPVPPVDEQQAVVRFLDAETAKLDVLGAEAERGITLLKERRGALIAAAVTGQIDVRNA